LEDFSFIALPAMLNQMKVEIFLRKFRKSPAKQFLEVTIIENYLQKMGGKFEKFALKK